MNERVLADRLLWFLTGFLCGLIVASVMWDYLHRQHRRSDRLVLAGNYELGLQLRECQVRAMDWKWRVKR